MPSPGPSQKRREPTLKPPFERSRTTAPKRRATLSPSHKSSLNQERAPLPRIRSLDKQLQTPPRPGVFNLLDVVLSAPVKSAKRARSESSTGSTSSTQSAKKKKRTDKAVEKETEKKGSANGEPCHGRRQPHLPGKPSSGSGSFATIPEGARGIQPVPCPEEGGHQRPRSVGFVLDPLSEPDVCRRLSKLPRRSSDGGLASSPLRIRPKRIFEIAPFLASHAGLQKAHAWEIQEGNALGGLGCHCSRSEKDQPPENGSFPSSVRINLCQALGIAESQSVLSCPTSAGRDTMLVSPAVAGRARRKNQNWRVRHVFDVGQHVDDRVDFPHFGVLEEEPSRVSTVGLRLHSLPQGIPRHCAEVPVGHDTLHVPTQWSVNRPGKKLSQSTRSPKARPVESSEEHYALREECKAGSSVGVIAPAFPAARPKLRGKPWGDAVGAKRRSNLHRKRAVGNQYVLDLFAGDGGVARACEHLGFRAKEWDVRHGPAQDLTSPKTIKRIFREIRRGRVLACMMAPVDTSFSVARDRTKAIRNQTYPWGIESSHLTHEEKRSIELGNACFRTCLQIMHMLDQYCIPYILASPATSKAWLLPPIEEQLSKAFCHHGHSRFLSVQHTLEETHLILGWPFRPS